MVLILKDISKLSYDLSQWAKNLPREVMKANDETAKIIIKLVERIRTNEQ